MSRRDPGRVGEGRRIGLLAAAVALAAACAPGPRVPPGVSPAPDPFQRTPYLQLPDGSSALVRWRVAGDPDLEFEYRVADDTAWRRAPVTVREGGDRQVLLKGLPPGARVGYRLRADDSVAGPYGFRTPPADGDEGATVLAFGDSGWGSEAQVRLARLMEREDWDLAVHVGDIAYDDGTEEDFTVRHFRVYRELLARTPFHPVPGNHDVRAEGGAAFDRAFLRADGAPGRRYRAFRWGGVQFVGLDTSADGALARLEEREGPQYRWLVETLERAAGDPTVRWTVVYTHYPLYSHAVGLSGHGPTEELREALEPLLLEHGVDLVLQGHDHHYERSRPLRDGRPVAEGCGPVYVVTGGGGASRYARAVKPDARVAEISRAHHYLGLRIGPEAMEGRAVGVQGTAIDSFRLEAHRPDRSRCAA